jgi:DNA polymerase III subunit epsilon
MENRTVDDSVLNSRFAVIDVETTGFYPRRDRILEIAIVQLSSSGSVLDEYVTLINPDRDIGDTSLHGISARDLLKAPAFADVAGDISKQLEGAILVGHNINFDRSFLIAEYARIGCVLPEMATLCTLELTSRFVPLRSHRLANCCAHFGISLTSSHEALSDARATAQLFNRCLDIIRRRNMRLSDLINWNSSCVSKVAWPSLPATGQRAERGQREKIDPEKIDTIPERSDLLGKSICFTGTLTHRFRGRPISRSMAESLAARAGLVVATDVTRSLDFLVTADPDSMSGKAKKARKYGTKILSESVFWRAIGLKVD